jgi:hypothetical protein
MAWNKHYIFVKNPQEKDLPTILSQLGLGDYKPKGEVTLAQASNPNTLFAGFCNDHLLIVHPQLPFDFFKPDSDTEKRFIQVFPTNEIAAIVFIEMTDLFGYALIEAGKKIRVNYAEDGEYYAQEGELLPEEEEALSGPPISEQELQIIKKEDGLSDEEIESMFQFGFYSEVPEELAKRYLGNNPFLSNIKITKYSL